MTERFSPARLIERHFLEGAEVRKAALEKCGKTVELAASLITAAFRNGKKLLLAGNGGSAADCQHLAAEFVSRLTKDFERKALPALALTTDSSIITAYSNDCGFDGIFARQIEALGQKGDVFLGISTSGNSKNIIAAVEEARRIGMVVVILCGEGGLLSSLSDACISIPSTSTQYIQECHLAVEHLLCAVVERSLFPEELLGAV